MFLGAAAAAALMSDGSSMSRVGTASITNLVKANNIPVLFCCETYKMNSRVQLLESVTRNELLDGDPDGLVMNESTVVTALILTTMVKALMQISLSR